MAKASTGSTNAKALHVSVLFHRPPQGDGMLMHIQVLSRIERKLAGFGSDKESIVSVKKQCQELVSEATSLENLAQGESMRLTVFRHSVSETKLQTVG